MQKKESNLRIVYYIISSLIILLFCVLIFIPYRPNISAKGYLDLSGGSFDMQYRHNVGNDFKYDSDYQSKQFDRYYLDLQLPRANQEVSFRLPPVFSDIILTINGNEILRKDSNMYPNVTIVNYHCTDSLLHIEMLVEKESSSEKSSFTDPTKSFDYYIGSIPGIYQYQKMKDLLYLAIIIITAMSIVIHIMSYSFRGRDIHLLYFAGILLTLAIGTMLTNQCTIKFFYPSFLAQTGIKIYILTYIARSILTIIYTNSLFKNTTLKYHNYIIILFNAILILPTLLVPTVNLFTVLKFAFIGNLLSTLLSIYITQHFLPENRFNGTTQLVICLSILLIGTFSDILFTTGWTRLISHLPMCTAIIVVLEIFSLSINYQNTIKNIDELTPMLKKNMTSIQDNKSTYISTHVKPFYLYETLESIKNNTGKDLDKVDYLVQALAKYLRQALDFSISPTDYSLHKELENCQAYAILVKEQYPNIHINIDYDNNIPDTSIPQLSIMSLIDNAVTYAFEGTLQPKIDVSATKQDDETILITIKDNGRGIHHKDISFILDIPNDDMSIGLYYINYILEEYYNSSLKIEAGSKRGTIISFKLPIRKREEVFYE